MISRAQLLDLGVASSSVTQAAALGRLYRVHPAVYSIAPPGARPRLAPEHAALLACGPGGAISHWSAAWLHGLTDRQPPRRSRSPSPQTAADGGLGSACTARRPWSLPTGPRSADCHAPSVARVVIDLSPSLLDDPQLEPLLDRALRVVTRVAMQSALVRAAGRPGTGRVQTLLDPERPSAEAWSKAERRLLELIRGSGLPMPECNVRLGDRGRVPDLLWRDARVIVEYDSWEFHSGPSSFHNDRERHNDLTAQGYQVLHVTWRVLHDHPEQVLVWIARALGRS